ncbi:hypothetical protein P4U05_12275 [Bacillus paranthracis]|uniref:hypothetical protein n=1 Tax=Bacillus TaxID=1386 RepID=UPI000200F4F0|nr:MULTISPECIES: hypothetical protein [Bacillus]ADY24355.1 hypothetical protein YBT020_25640 [Bacillus thuringiensis serovar finitimus YBT-020]MCW4577220.1 hypothetical protein [Bacillus pacificus]MDA1585514.1 hypothetical protein [Bacillus cereus group sp. TH230-1LC]MRC72458.1 hypothetical protein [Bacillus thuringiensis]OTX73109.1 hypothetical protein BK722_11310 [Bacillus thuringiensis serovar finitimus]
MNFILENKWTFLIMAEAIFWISIICFLLLRYWFEFKKLSIAFFILFIVNDLWIATMGFFDYLNTGKFSNYQLIIVIIIVYALTYGKTDFRKLDAFIQKKVAKWKGNPIPELPNVKKLSGKEHAKMERKHFSIHLLIYIVAHVVLVSIFGLSDQLTDIHSIWNTLVTWFEEKQPHFPSNNIAFNNLSRVWSLILAIDAVISLSYTFFPKKGTSKNTSY